MALPEPQRLAVVLVYVEGFSYAEASSILDIPVGTVMSRLATARRHLSEKLNVHHDTAKNDARQHLKKVG
jgi:RNA polymerase sigma-70 factor (ECF subfamily)